MIAVLERLGFKEVEERQFRESRISDIASLEAEERKDETFYGECVR